MKLKEVTSIPKGKKGYKDLARFIDEFENSDMKMAEVIFREEEYKSASSCASSLYKAAKRSRYAIQVTIRNGHVYLVKE